MNIKSKIESLLFASIKPLSLKELSSVLKVDKEEVELAVKELTEDYQSQERGLALINHGGKYQLTSSADNAKLVKDFLQSDVTGELSQPSLEALTIIAYRGPISKMELERIRGVNCSLIIRNLLLRGLIEEKFNKRKEENFYNITLDFVRFLGINEISDLPDYDKLNKSETLQEIVERVEEEVN